MNYIYDVYLNFKKVPYDFFEWNKKDTLTHLKKVPIYKVDFNTFKDIISNKIQINNNFLKKIKYKTEVWKDKKNVKYCSLFCTNNSILAISFNENGVSNTKSFLYIDEELEILETLQDIKEYKIDYNIIKNEFILLKTRKEKFKENFINNKLKNIDNNKLNYIYFECFGKRKNRKTMLSELSNIDSDSNEYKKLYNVLKLISTIKK